MHLDSKQTCNIKQAHHTCVYARVFVMCLLHAYTQLATCVPPDRLLIESDAEGAGRAGPDSSSRRSGSTVAERRISDVAATCTAIAAHLGMSPQELAHLTAANAQRAFSCC
jgi:Tat protein secretion system quality control protein TatD with DNase activity